MKKILPLLAIAVIAVVSFSNAVSAKADASAQYALMPGDTAFYAATGEGYDVRAYLPSSYYVTILDTSGTYYRINYGDLTGYVRQSAVTLVDYEPVTKFAYGSATLKAGIASVFLYESSGLSGALATVTTDTAVDVYGYVDSGSPVYYCRIKVDNTSVRGYLPPAGVDVVMPERNDGSRINSAAGPGENANTTPEENEPESFALQIILAIALVVPSVLIMLLVFSRKKRPEEE